MRFKIARNAQQKLSFFTGLAVVLVAAFAVAVPKAYAADCGPNAIIQCGFTSNSDFISKTKANNDPNGKDLPAVFNYFGLGSGDYDRFVSTAKDGTVYKDGRIVVAGQTVMTKANSLGRTSLDGRHDKSIPIGSGKYYYGQTSRVFSTDSFPAKVLFDEKGEVEFAVMPTCGNPIWGEQVPSSAKCAALKSEPVTGKPGAYSFTTTASATGNDTITKYVYDFGDGKPITTTSGATAVPYTFAPGSHKVKVTVYATVPGGNTITSTCETTVTVEEPVKPVVPFYECVDVKGPGPQGLKYTFTATAKYGNGAVFSGANFTYGDGKTDTNVKPTTANTVTVEHTYDKAGNYNVTAVLLFTVDGKTVTANGCNTSANPAAPSVPECKPGVPVGDVRCNPCVYDSSLAASDARCKQAVVTQTLPNTGAGNIIAFSSAALVGGFLFYRHRLFLRNKAAFYAAENGTSPLPLADPITSEDPLANTPLEPEVKQAVRSTFRRRRPF